MFHCILSACLVSAMSSSSTTLPIQTKPDDRATKLRKLDARRRRLPHVTASALSAVYEDIAEHGLPDLTSRNNIAQASTDIVLTDTPYGPLMTAIELVPSEPGEDTINVPAINPLAFLWAAFYQGGSFTFYFANLLCDYARHYFRIIFYADEITPGKELAHANLRKHWNIYWSFIEMKDMFHKEELWFPLLTVRTDVVGRAKSGISQVFAESIKLFFGLCGTDMSASGISLKSPCGVMYRLFARLAMILQDGGAHKAVFGCKGDSGTKMCMLCRNLVAEESDIIDEDGDNVLTYNLIHEEDLDLAVDDDVFGAVDRLQALEGTVSQGEFKLRQQAAGFTLTPLGVLLQLALRGILKPVSHFCHDWMHTIASSGCGQTVVFLFIMTISRPGFNVYESLNGYMQQWTWPARYRDDYSSLFTTKRRTANTKAKTFKCIASELISIFPVIAFYVYSVVLPSGLFQEAARAVLSLADIIEILQIANYEGSRLVNTLRGAIREFLQACTDAEWTAWMHPKFHWLVHLPGHLKKFGCLPSCFVHERKHRVSKRYGGDVRNTRNYDFSLLKEVCCHNLAGLKDNQLSNHAGLVKPHEPNARLRATILESLGMEFRNSVIQVGAESQLDGGGFCSKGDAVLLRPPSQINNGMSCGFVTLHMDIDGTPYSLIDLFRIDAQDKRGGAAVWTCDLRNHVVIPTVDLIAAVVYTTLGRGKIRTLVPWKARTFDAVNS